MSIIYDKKYTIVMNKKGYQLDVYTIEKLVKSFTCGQVLQVICTWTSYDNYGNSRYMHSKKEISRMKNPTLNIDAYLWRLFDVNSGRTKTRKYANMIKAQKSAYHYYIEQLHDEDGYKKQLDRIKFNWNWSDGVSYGLTNQK